MFVKFGKGAAPHSGALGNPTSMRFHLMRVAIHWTLDFQRQWDAEVGIRHQSGLSSALIRKQFWDVFERKVVDVSGKCIGLG